MGDLKCWNKELRLRFACGLPAVCLQFACGLPRQWAPQGHVRPCDALLI